MRVRGKGDGEVLRAEVGHFRRSFRCYHTLLMSMLIVSCEPALDTFTP